MYVCMYVCRCSGAVVVLDFRSEGRWFEAWSLLHSVFLSTQVYKWVPATKYWGVTLQWTSIPSRGE